MEVYMENKNTESTGSVNTEKYYDHMIRVTAADAQVRAFAVTARDLVEEARRIHNTSPIATAALGRLMCGALMMGDMLKNDGDLLTIQIQGDGPLGALLATTDRHGNVKGYVRNTAVILPPNAQGHLNVGGGVGKGVLTVIRDMGLKEPYVGQIPIHSGEIADDLAWYYAQSEQINSSVALGVLMNHDVTVREAGGFMIQLMPDASEEVISRLEQNLSTLDSVTDMLRNGVTPMQMLQKALDGFEIHFNGQIPVHYHCNCSHEHFALGLAMLGKKEVQSMIDDGQPITVNCQYCGKSYTYSLDELQKILKAAK